jgi:hypothetical protein
MPTSETTTREQQIREAERIAASNPEWLWDGRAHLMKGLAVVRTADGGRSWLAYPPPTGAGAPLPPPLCGPSGRLRRFRSPGAAIRALGFDITEEEGEDNG